MSNYEVLAEGGKTMVVAKGGTRAGLFVAALQGLFSAAGAQRLERADMEERRFSVEDADGAALLQRFLEEALRLATAHGEAYEEVRFDLVTDKKASGVMVGRKTAVVTHPVKALGDGLAMEKKEMGWEARIPLET